MKLRRIFLDPLETYIFRPWKLIPDLIKEAHAFWQRGSRGWADCDTWSFDGYLEEVLAGGLMYLSKNTAGYPEEMDYKTWKKSLRKCALAFKAVQEYEEEGFVHDKHFRIGKKIYKKEGEALEFITKWFGHLWY